MLFVKLFLIAAGLLAQGHFFKNVPSEPDEGNVNVTVTDSTLAAIRARIAADASSPDASSPDASSPDSDSSRIEAPVAAR